MANNSRVVDRAGWVSVPPELQTILSAIAGGQKIDDRALVALVEFVIKLGVKVNGGISFGDATPGAYSGNVDGQWPDDGVTSPATPGQEFTVYHGLGRVPVGRLVLGQNAAGSLYDSQKESWTETKAMFKCDAASVKFNLVLV